MKGLFIRVKDGCVILLENGEAVSVSFVDDITKQLNIEQRALYGTMEEVEVEFSEDSMRIIRDKILKSPNVCEMTINWIKRFPFLKHYFNADSEVP